MSNRLNASLNETSLKYFSTDESRGRRLLEMHRRLKGLQAKRFHLRNELEAVDKYLTSLDSQIKGLESYQQFALNDSRLSRN